MPDMQRPSVVILAGPNGSGKSTAAVRLLHDTLSMLEFVNADVIAQGLSAFRPEGVAVAAGRIMLKRLDELARSEESFAFETTLASRSFASWLNSIQRAHGYQVRLVYVWLQTVELNIQRVATRVSTGGHHVPEETIRRRYYRSIANLFDLYMPIATTWGVFENSNTPQVALVASGGRDQTLQIHDPHLWTLLRSRYDTARNEPAH
jgi:predicted ABC-type ATPase